MVEHRSPKPRVVGSIPTAPATSFEVSSMWILLALASAVLYAATWLFARASKGIPVAVVTSAQFAIGPIVLIHSAWVVDFPWHEPLWIFYLGFNTFIGPIILLGFTYASQRVEVSIIKPLTGLTSIAALFFSVVLFHETFPLLGILGIVLTTLGLLLLYKGRWYVWKTPYPWIILFGVLIFGINTVMAREVYKFFPHVIPMSSAFLSGGFFFNAVVAGKKWFTTKWSWRRVGFMTLFALTVWFQDVFTIAAVALAPAPYVLAVKRLSILFAALGGYYIFKERDQSLPRLMMAVTLVILGIVVIAFQ